jgi:hypothetical protein
LDWIGIDACLFWGTFNDVGYLKYCTSPIQKFKEEQVAGLLLADELAESGMTNKGLERATNPTDVFARNGSS